MLYLVSVSYSANAGYLYLYISVHTSRYERPPPTRVLHNGVIRHQLQMGITSAIYTCIYKYIYSYTSANNLRTRNQETHSQGMRAAVSLLTVWDDSINHRGFIQIPMDVIADPSLGRGDYWNDFMEAFSIVEFLVFDIFLETCWCVGSWCFLYCFNRACVYQCDP